MASSQRQRIAFALAALAVAALAAFWNSFGGVFVLDDVPNLVANTKLAPLWPPTAELWAEPGRGLSGRPLVAFSFALDRAVWGLEPHGYHVTNLVIHVLAAWALFGVVRELLGLARAGERLAARRDAFAFAVALLWVVHPLQVTAVTYVVQRCESLMGLAFLAAMWCALKSFRAERATSWGWLATGLMACGALVKESIAVLPVCVLVLDVAFESGSLAAAWRVRKALYSKLASVWLWSAAWVLVGGVHRASAAGLLPEFTWWAWLRTQAVALVHYARVAAWPDPVLIDYGWPFARSTAEWLPAGLLVLAAVVVAWLGWLRGSRAAAVLLVAFVLLAPTSSVLPIPFELWALHRMYLPLGALIALAVAGVAKLLAHARAASAIGGPLLILVAGLGAARTYAVNRDFESAERLWSLHVRARPENDRAWFQLAEALRARGDARGALAAYRRAAELHPTYPLWLNNLGTLELALGETDAAIATYTRACELLPTAMLARANLVEALLVRGDIARAERELEPLLVGVVDRPALAGSAESASVRRLHARVLARRGREVEALGEAQAALRLEPRDFGAFETLVLLRASAEDASVRDVGVAERLLAGVQSPPPTRAAELGRLAAVVLAAGGRFDEALARAKQTLELARSEGRVQLAATLERELATYAARQPPRAFVR